MKTRLIITILAVLLTAGSVNSQPLHLGYMSVAAMGMGGSYTAYPRDATMTVTNPALLNRAKFHLTILSFPIGMDNEIFEFVDFVKKHSEDLENYETLSPQEKEELLHDAEPFDDKWYHVNTNAFMGLTVPAANFGAAIYNDMLTGAKIDQGIILPAVGLKGYSDLGIAFAKGFNFMDFEAGLGLRFYQRSSFTPIRVSANDIGSMTDILSEGLEELEDKKSGFGIDAGVIRTINDKLDLAVTVQDLIGSHDGWVKPNLITGIAYQATEELLLCADMNDWFNTQGVGFFQKLNMGAEYRLPLLLDVRIGIHQGYPTAGVGLRLLILKLDYAYFGKEGGNLPGQIQEYSHRFGITIGIN